jgi:hypothetical protein
LLTGCASYHGRPLISSGAASSYLEHMQRDGLHVAVIDLSSERSSEKHFDRDLPDYEYVPVQLLVELDANAATAFNMKREDLVLVLQDGTRLAAADPLVVVDNVAFSHWRSFFGFLFVLPGPFVASSVSSANDELESDYLEKALRSVRVSHNMRVYQGVVFFEIPDDLDGPLNTEDAFVEVSVGREGDGNGVLGQRLQFPVHFTR